MRGAYNKIVSLSETQKKQGIIAFSSGNHAQGVAYAAQKLQIKATIVMPAIAPAIKIANTKAFGAEVVLLKGGGEEEWREAAEKLASYWIYPHYNFGKYWQGFQKLMLLLWILAEHDQLEKDAMKKGC